MKLKVGEIEREGEKEREREGGRERGGERGERGRGRGREKAKINNETSYSCMDSDLTSIHLFI